MTRVFLIYVTRSVCVRLRGKIDSAEGKRFKDEMINDKGDRNSILGKQKNIVGKCGKRVSKQTTQGENAIFSEHEREMSV